MSMSMFSSFDALCAEKLGFSWSAQAPAAVKTDDLKKTSGEAASSSSKAPKDRRKTRSPRFAVELDGVHCFETIVPY